MSECILITAYLFTSTPVFVEIISFFYLFISKHVSHSYFLFYISVEVGVFVYDLLTLTENLNSPMLFSEVHVTQY